MGMKMRQIKDVMKKYGKAWEKRDVNLILECFTPNGIYQESPLATKPYKGHKKIAEFWQREVVDNSKNIHFKLGKCYISQDGKTGFAEWECILQYLNKKEKMVGIMILKMKDNKIVHLNEYWDNMINGEGHLG